MILVFLTGILATRAYGAGLTHKTEIVEEQPKTENKTFCAKGNAQEAEALCAKWLTRQLKTLGDKVLTSNCTAGDMTTDANCLYKAEGDITWLLKKYRTETERH